MKVLQKEIRLSLRAKLTLLIESFIIIIVVITGIITTLREKETLENELTKRGFALATDLSQFTVRPIINNDLPTLRRFVTHTMEHDYVRYAIVLDPHGKVLMHSDLAEVNKTYKDSLSIAALNSDAPGSNEVNASMNEEKQSDIFVPIKIVGVRLGTVRLGYSHMAVEKQMAKARQQILLIGLLTTMSGGVVAFLLATFISSPIKRITDATKNVAHGNLNPHLAIKRNDEIGTLASAFNRMTEDLQKTTVSKDYFDNIIESMNDTLVVVSVDGKIKDINKATCELLEYSEDELIGRDIHVIVPKEERIFSNSGFQSMVEQSIPVNREIDYLAKSGKRIPMLFSAAVLKSKEEKIDGVVCIARDITDRKRFDNALLESEKRYRTIVEDQTELICRFSAGEKLTFVNEAYCRYFNKRPGELLGKSFMQLVPEEDHDKVLKHFNSLNQETPVATHEHRVISPHGEIRWQQWTNRALFDAHGNIIEIQSVGRDITDRKRAEEALRKSEGELRFLSSRLLKAQEEERRRLSIELHDELGQELMVLKLKMRTIQEKMNDESVNLKGECDEVISYINEVTENVRRLSRDLSPSILEDLGLTAAIRWLVEAFTKHSNIEILLDMTEIDNLFSHEGQITIYRIIQECLTNIAKHSHATSVSITIKKMDKDVIFNVEDDGKGFHVQEVFKRDPTTMGLGLAAMHERIRMLGGLLYILSDEGTGTKIIFSIPLSPGGNEQ